MRIVGCASESEDDAEFNQSFSSSEESDAEEEKHGEMPKFILSDKDLAILEIKKENGSTLKEE